MKKQTKNTKKSSARLNIELHAKLLLRGHFQVSFGIIGIRAAINVSAAIPSYFSRRQSLMLVAVGLAITPQKLRHQSKRYVTLAAE